MINIFDINDINKLGSTEFNPEEIFMDKELNTGVFKKIIENALKAETQNEKETTKNNDAVNHPSHYTQGGIECIDAMKASMSDEAFKGLLKGNVIKYIWRYEKKVNPLEDLKKAKWYLERLIKELEEVK